ncbi:MAG: retroviral-like aspartic protease family protein [Thaumarchaeota archaeon]|nr:retroviral-like aspartic protease family protein [Nitrososphaerota archaeon]
MSVRVHGTEGHRDVEMLVDTGALYTKISPALARELGITPNEVIRVRLADGTLGEASLADAVIEYGPSKRTVTVLVGPGDEPLLGLTTLEVLRLKLNPVDGTLERMVPYLYAV